jgi:hypothetical protein
MLGRCDACHGRSGQIQLLCNGCQRFASIPKLRRLVTTTDQVMGVGPPGAVRVDAAAAGGKRDDGGVAEGGGVRDPT